MGMYCSMYRATGAELERLIQDPDRVEAFLEGIEGPGLPVREIKPKGLLGLLYRLSPITITEVDSDASRPDPEPPNPEQTVNIDKGWHGLHYLLAQAADEGEETASLFMCGGEPLDDEGYVRALRPAQVRSLAEYMNALSAPELEGRYDPARMTEFEIYPGVWEEPSEDEHSGLAWLLDCFEEVRAFVARAAAVGDGVIVNIS